MSLAEINLYVARIIANVTYLFVMEPPLWLQVIILTVPLPLLLLAARLFELTIMRNLEKRSPGPRKKIVKLLTIARCAVIIK